MARFRVGHGPLGVELKRICRTGGGIVVRMRDDIEGLGGHPHASRRGKRVAKYTGS